jgi:NADH:ubiquinone oxidoreductase subunit F (NADH-binding)
VDHETFQRLGSGLGCGAISVITDDCPVALAASVLAYFDRENAGQCGSCFNGTAAMAAVAGALRDGVATDEDLTRHWMPQPISRRACWISSRTPSRVISTIVARHANSALSAPTVPTRWRR